MLTSLALQNDDKIGTASFSSSEVKNNAMKGRINNWILNDDFEGITILNNPEDAELE